MKNRTFSIISGVLGTILLIAHLWLTHKPPLRDYLLYASIALYVLFWILSIVDVSTAADLKYYQKMFWLIITVSVPLVGGCLYYVMHQKPGKIVS